MGHGSLLWGLASLRRVDCWILSKCYIPIPECSVGIGFHSLRRAAWPRLNARVQVGRVKEPGEGYLTMGEEGTAAKEGGKGMAAR